MCNRLLEANGAIKTVTHPLSSSVIELVAGEDTIEGLKSLHDKKQILIKFASSADGRGFSMAAALRETHEFGGKLFASGQLIPDQITLAFQCGFDAVIVNTEQWNRYGKEAWMNAMNPHVNQRYLRSHSSGLDSIWERRAVVQ